MVAILEKRRFRDFDWLLTLLAVGIVAFGTWQIYNAQPTEGYWKKQIIGLAVSLGVMFVISFTDYRKLVRIAPAFYLFGLVLLVLVLVPGIGVRINGVGVAVTLPSRPVADIPPTEAADLTRLVDAFTNAVSAHDLDGRLAKLEAAAKQ